jgi:hypothetical protein
MLREIRKKKPVDAAQDVAAAAAAAFHFLPSRIRFRI